MSNNTFSRILRIGSVLIILFQSSVISQVILDPDAVVEEIVTGIQQPEGPVWREGVGLLFSDIKGNKIYKLTPEKGKEIYLDPSYNTNGLAYDLEGRLVAGQMGLRRVVRFEEDGSPTALADSYNGKKLNSPNDLAIKSDGSIFFTDPDFNIPQGESKELSFNGIYRISPSGALQLLTSSLALPNGICFSPDESKLYVNDSQVHKIYVWDVVDDSTITNQKLLYTIPVMFGYADGMKIDEDGNIYCTCSSYVWVISPEGELIGKIALPSNVSASNCAWGDDDNRTLFITAGSSVYRVRPLVTSINREGSNFPESFELFQNYPNPFNPTTKITYSIPVTSNVVIKVYDMSGREVVTVEDCQKNAGTHTLLFDAEKLASGVYYYNLTANEFSSTKKFVILK